MTEIAYKSEESELARGQAFNMQGANRELQEAQNLLAKYKNESWSIKIAIGDIIKLMHQSAIKDALTKILVQYELKKQELYQKMETLKNEQLKQELAADEKTNNTKTFVGSLVARISKMPYTLVARYETLRRNKETMKMLLFKAQDIIRVKDKDSLKEIEKTQRRISGIRRTIGEYTSISYREEQPQDEIISSEDLELDDSINTSRTVNFVNQERSTIIFGKGTIEFNADGEFSAEENDETDTREVVESRYQKNRGNIIQSLRRNATNLIDMFNNDENAEIKENSFKNEEIDEKEETV